MKLKQLKPSRNFKPAGIMPQYDARAPDHRHELDAGVTTRRLQAPVVPPANGGKERCARRCWRRSRACKARSRLHHRPIRRRPPCPGRSASCSGRAWRAYLPGAAPATIPAAPVTPAAPLAVASPPPAPGAPPPPVAAAHPNSTTTVRTIQRATDTSPMVPDAQAKSIASRRRADPATASNVLSNGGDPGVGGHLVDRPAHRRAGRQSPQRRQLLRR